jgi:hypothetical protein
MPAWKNIPITYKPDGTPDFQNFGIELNRRIKYYLDNIDIAQILFNLNDIGGTLNLSKGGTGAQLSAPAADRILFYDLSDNKVDWLTAGSGLTVDDKTLKASLAAVILGTTNQITVTDNLDGTYTLSTPQDLHTGADVSFDDVTGTGKVKGATGHFGGDTHYSEFEADGTYKANGNATTYDDLLGDVTRLQVVGVGIAFDNAENAVKFQTSANLSDYVIANYQIRHRWKAGSSIYPHIHFEQAQNQVPNFLIRSRWQRNGSAKTTTWTDYKCNTLAFTYVSGTLNNIAYGAAITAPSGYSISDIIELRIFRDNGNTSTVFAGADPYTTDVLVTGIDIHIEEDTLGSRTEYTK